MTEKLLIGVIDTKQTNLDEVTLYKVEKTCISKL